MFKKINEIFAEEAKAYERRAKGELRTYAAGERRRIEAEGGTFSPHTYQRTFTVTYEKGNYLSVLEEEYGFEGGAFPSAGRCAHTFDLVTGEEAPLHEVLGLSQEEAEELVEERFTALIDQEPELYLAGAKEKLTELMDRMDFYLEESDSGEAQAVVYFPMDTLAPRALGFPQLSLQIQKNS